MEGHYQFIFPQQLRSFLLESLRSTDLWIFCRMALRQVEIFHHYYMCTHLCSLLQCSPSEINHIHHSFLYPLCHFSSKMLLLLGVQKLQTTALEKSLSVYSVRTGGWIELNSYLRGKQCGLFSYNWYRYAYLGGVIVGLFFGLIFWVRKGE